jgi:hypothetical protein
MSDSSLAYWAAARLTALQFEQLLAHRELDAQAACRRPPSELLEAAISQIHELDELISSNAASAPDRPQRIALGCANAANFLAFLAAHFEPTS